MSVSPGCGWGVMTFLSLSRLAPDIPSCFSAYKASLHGPFYREGFNITCTTTGGFQSTEQASPSSSRTIYSSSHSLTVAEITAQKKRVVENEEWEKELGICGILCNELVRKECGSDRE